MKLLVSLAISALFLYLTLRGLDLGAIGHSLSLVNLWLLVPAILVHLSSFWIRSLRWSAMLSPLKPLRPAAVFPALAISYLANNTLPMRAGEFVRAYLLGKNENISKTASFSTILLERIFDGLTLLLFLGVVSLLVPLPAWVQQVGIFAGSAFVGVTLLMIGLVFFRETTLSLVRWCLRPLPQKIADKVEGLLGSFVSGLDVLQDARALLQVAAWSLVIWGLEAAALAITAHACGLTLPMLGATFALVIINLGTMIPSSPGYVGTFEFFCVKSLSLFQILEAPAMGFALVLHVIQFVPITLVGLACLVRQPVSLRGLTTQKGSIG
ncbi:flippase-like domain-containing protein [bacterium]|nr:flippase-like domain-containing protein [bacterium]